MSSVQQSSVFIIAEIGVNHDGEFDKAVELIETACHAGADAVKFQSFSAAQLANASAELAEYQDRQIDAANQLEMLAKLELSAEQFQSLYDICQSKSIDFISTAFDESWLKCLVDMGVRHIKWPSGELTNHVFLRQAAEYELPIFLSTGMGTLAEVEAAVAQIAKVWDRSSKRSLANDLTIMHCTSLYPAPIETLNLKALVTLRQHFGTAIGYSDHSSSNLAAQVCMGMGVTVFEKHITYDCNAEGPDHSASLDSVGFAEYVNIIRKAEWALGNGEKLPHALELDTARAARKSLFVIDALAQGDAITTENLMSQRPGTGIGVENLERVIGKVVRRPISAGHMLTWEDVSE